jgi:hypothetical protein
MNFITGWLDTCSYPMTGTLEWALKQLQSFDCFEALENRLSCFISWSNLALCVSAHLPKESSKARHEALEHNSSYYSSGYKYVRTASICNSL